MNLCCFFLFVCYSLSIRLAWKPKKKLINNISGPFVLCRENYPPILYYSVYYSNTIVFKTWLAFFFCFPQFVKLTYPLNLFWTKMLLKLLFVIELLKNDELFNVILLMIVSEIFS